MVTDRAADAAGPRRPPPAPLVPSGWTDPELQWLCYRYHELRELVGTVFPQRPPDDLAFLGAQGRVPGSSVERAAVLRARVTLVLDRVGQAFTRRVRERGISRPMGEAARRIYAQGDRWGVTCRALGVSGATLSRWLKAWRRRLAQDLDALPMAADLRVDFWRAVDQLQQRS